MTVASHGANIGELGSGDGEVAPGRIIKDGVGRHTPMSVLPMKAA